MTPIRKHSVRISGHVTSVSLEEPFWQALKEIAAARNMSVNKLVGEIDASRTRAGDMDGLSSALRVYALAWFRGGGPAGRTGADRELPPSGKTPPVK